MNIRKTISATVGTGTTGNSGSGGPATSAQIGHPENVFIDTSANIYFSDSGQLCYVHLTLALIIYTATFLISTIQSGIFRPIIGTSVNQYSGENVPTTSGSISYPIGIAVDTSNGDMYFASHQGNRIQVASATTGLLTTFAGNGSPTFSGDGGAATAASMSGPAEISRASDGTLYIGEFTGNRVRMVYSTAPTLTPSAVPSMIPTAVSVAPTFAPTVCAPSVTPTGRPSSARSSLNFISTAMGTGLQASSGSGMAATSATLYNPRGVWGDSMGTIYVSERASHCARKFTTANNIVVSVAGVCGAASTYNGDSIAATAAALCPTSLMGLSTGVLYVADLDNVRVRKLDNGVISTVAGIGTSGTAGNGGLATAAQVFGPYGVFVDSAGRIYVCSTVYNHVRVISSSGIINFLAGSSSVASFTGDNGPATTATLKTPESVCADTTGFVYISDSGKFSFVCSELVNEVCT